MALLAGAAGVDPDRSAAAAGDVDIVPITLPIVWERLVEQANNHCYSTVDRRSKWGAKQCAETFSNGLSIRHDNMTGELGKPRGPHGQTNKIPCCAHTAAALRDTRETINAVRCVW